MIGSQFGRWIIDRELGKGAMGSVYRAHAADAPAEVRALKVLAPDLARDTMARQRFQRETDVLCSLDHANIVRFDGAGVHDDNLYYVMEYINGPDCESRLHDVGRWPWSEVLDLAIQVTRGLKYAHDQGIIHRDLKPANLLLAVGEDNGAGKFQVKIADFGVARMFSQGQLTGSGQFIGTALYMAPEQAAGKPATKRSDFYALGCVMYTLLTGRPPFNGTSLAELVHKHQFVQPERPSRLLVDLPHDIDDLIVQLLSKDPSVRPGDGSVLLKRLESIRGKLVRKHNLTDTAFRPAASRPGKKAEWSEVGGAESDRERSPFSFGKPIRAVGLFLALVVVIGLIVWKFNKPRMTAEEYYLAAKPLMESQSPADWEKAWRDYLEPMTLRYPDHAYKNEVETIRHLIDDQATLRRLKTRTYRGNLGSEAQRFYEQGLTRFQTGDVDGARKLWEQVIAAFGTVESEKRWVNQARVALTELTPAATDVRNAPAVAAAMEQAKKFRDNNERGKAEAIWMAIEELYKNDPSGREILETIRADRAKKP